MKYKIKYRDYLYPNDQYSLHLLYVLKKLKQSILKSKEALSASGLSKTILETLILISMLMTCL